MNNVTQSKRGRPRKEPVVMTESKGWLMLDAQAQIRDTIRLMLAAYQQISNGQRLIFQT